MPEIYWQHGCYSVLHLRMDLTFTLDKIEENAKLFWDAVKDAKVFAFHGEMGAGKTTFIHALCEQKQVEDVVSSPTFSIINEYNYHEDGMLKRIYHIDLYRLKSEEEAMRAGVEDCIYSGDICLVEWPEKAPGLFPEETVHITIQLLESGKRKISFI